MQLRRIIKECWDVLAVCDSDGHCQLLEDFHSLNDRALVSKMMALFERTAVQGPPMSNEQKCKQLTRHIFEFKARPRRGAQLRVLWFYDKGQIVVCTHAFVKTTRKTPPGEIKRAEEARKNYIRAKASSAVPVICDVQEG